MPTADTTTAAAEGYYVTMQRGQRTAYLLGPELTKEAAEARVPEGRRLAYDVDAFAVFDAFGVTRVKMQPGASLPAGKLNHLAHTADAPGCDECGSSAPRGTLTNLHGETCSCHPANVVTA